MNTIVPGAQRATDSTGVPLQDSKGRPAWNKPDPTRHVRHFRSAGMRRKYENGEISFDQATHEVPIHKGADIKTARAIRESIRYRKRLEERRKQGPFQRLAQSLPKANKHHLQPDLSPDETVRLIREHGSIAEVSRQTGYSKDAIRRRRDKAKREVA